MATEHRDVFELQMILAQAKAQAGDGGGAMAAAERGVAAISRLVELHPRQARLRSGQGQVLASLGRPEEAVEAFKAAAGMEPENPGHAAALAQLLRALGRDEEAAQWQGIFERLSQGRNEPGR
jgi:tetratricopeptide (TPR) repeat protein